MTLQEAFIHTADDHKLDADIAIDPPVNIDANDTSLTSNALDTIVTPEAVTDTFTTESGTTLTEAQITELFPKLNTPALIAADARFTQVEAE